MFWFALALIFAIGGTALFVWSLQPWLAKRKVTRRRRPTKITTLTLTSAVGLTKGTVIEIGPGDGRYVVRRVLSPNCVKVRHVHPKAPRMFRIRQWIKGN